MNIKSTCLLAIAAVALSSSAIGAPLRDARRLNRQDKPLKATQLALRTLKQDPDNWRAQRLSTRYLDALILKRLDDAEALRSQRQWSKAIEHLTEVNGLVAKAKAQDLTRGACRQAIEDLKVAEALGPGSQGADLNRGRAYAKTSLILKTQGQGLDTAAFQASLSSSLQEKGTAYLTVYTKPGEAPPRLVPAVDQGAPVSEGPYQITITVAPPLFRAQPPQHSIQSVWTSTISGCLDPYGNPWPGACRQDIYVTYDEVREDIRGEMTLSVAIKSLGENPKDISQVYLRAFGEESARWRAGIRTATTGSSGYGTSTTVWSNAPHSNPGSLAKEARRGAQERLVQGLTLQLIDKATATLLGTLDVEAKVPDHLQIQAAP